MQSYVVGFMFSPSYSRVGLIRKNKPDWQRGKLNGIGGKIEPGEAPLQAMVREFQEETGWGTEENQWHYFSKMSGRNDDGRQFEVHFFSTTGSVECLRSTTDEQVEVCYVDQFTPLRLDTIENLVWLLALAIDHMVDGRPKFVESKY